MSLQSLPTSHCRLDLSWWILKLCFPIWICTWIHTYTLFKPFLVPQKSHFFNEFIYEFMILHEFMYDSMLWIHHDMQTFLDTPEFMLFMNSYQVSWTLALFHGRDHILIHFWRRSWRILSKVWWFHGSLKRIIHWIHCQWRGHWHWCSVSLSDWASPTCSCCSRATCHTISWCVQSCTNLNLVTSSSQSPSQCSNFSHCQGTCLKPVSAVTSIRVHVWNWTLPIVRSESHYMTSVRHSKY